MHKKALWRHTYSRAFREGSHLEYKKSASKRIWIRFLSGAVKCVLTGMSWLHSYLAFAEDGPSLKMQVTVFLFFGGSRW